MKKNEAGKDAIRNKRTVCKYHEAPTTSFLASSHKDQRKVLHLISASDSVDTEFIPNLPLI